MELYGCVRNSRRPVLGVILVDLDSLQNSSVRYLYSLPEILRNIGILSVASGAVGTSLLSSITIFATRENDLVSVLPTTPLLPSTWEAVESTLSQLKQAFREANLMDRDAMTSAPILELLQRARQLYDNHHSNGTTGDHHPSLQLVVLVITARDLAEVETWAGGEYPPTPDRLTRVIIPTTPRFTSYITHDLEDGQLLEVQPFFETVFVSSAIDLERWVKGSLLASSNNPAQPCVCVELSSKGCREQLLLDLHPRAVVLEEVSSSVFRAANTMGHGPFVASRVVEDAGICESSLSGVSFFATPTSCYDLDARESEDNAQKFRALHTHLYNNESCLLFESERNIFVMRPLDNRMFLIKAALSSETLLPVPQAIPIPSLDDYSGGKIISILNDLPHDNIFNPAEFRTEIGSQIDEWIQRSRSEASAAGRSQPSIQDFVSKKKGRGGRGGGGGTKGGKQRSC